MRRPQEKRRRQLLTPEQQAKHDGRYIREFNQRFPVGSRIWFWKTLPFGPVIETTVRGEAFVADSGHLVCLLQGVIGYVSIVHIREIDEARRKDLTFAWISAESH